MVNGPTVTAWHSIYTHASYVLLSFHVVCVHFVATLCVCIVCSTRVLTTVSTVYGENDNKALLTWHVQCVNDCSTPPPLIMCLSWLHYPSSLSSKLNLLHCLQTLWLPHTSLLVSFWVVAMTMRRFGGGAFYGSPKDVIYLSRLSSNNHQLSPQLQTPPLIQ